MNVAEITSLSRDSERVNQDVRLVGRIIELARVFSEEQQRAI
jgi:hypothetical protein